MGALKMQDRQQVLSSTVQVDLYQVGYCYSFVYKNFYLVNSFINVMYALNL